MDADNKYGIKEIQEKLLEILLYYKDFCDSQGLKFVLAGGTCLGAARDGGMIPWDDDVDVFMLREDYEKLIPLWNQYANTDKYTCIRSDDSINIHHAVTEIKDNNTTFINRHSVDLDIHQGLMIDVIPLDNVSASKIGQLQQAINAMLFSCYNFQRLPEHKSKAIYYATMAALSLIKSPKLRYRIWKHAENRVINLGERSNGNVASFTEGMTIMKQWFPRKWFEEPAFLTFEGVKMPVPYNYDQWLRVSYGDYMTPPPEKDRVLRHDVVFYDMNNSYKKYKGIHYCK